MPGTRVGPGSRDQPIYWTVIFLAWKERFMLQMKLAERWPTFAGFSNPSNPYYLRANLAERWIDDKLGCAYVKHYLDGSCGLDGVYPFKLKKLKSWV